MKKLMKKLADLSTYLDDRGHKEEAHQLDHTLYSLAEDPPSWLNPIDRMKWEAANAKNKGTGSMEGRKMMEGVETDTPKTSKEPAAVQTEYHDKPAAVNPVTPGPKVVVIEQAGFEPMRVTKMTQIQKLVNEPRISDKAIIDGIYKSIGLDMVPPDATLQKAIADGVKTGYIQDDRSFWNK